MWQRRAVQRLRVALATRAPVAQRMQVLAVPCTQGLVVRCMQVRVVQRMRDLVALGMQGQAVLVTLARAEPVVPCKE